MKTKVKVVRVKGERRAQRKIERMLRDGWELQDQSARKALFSGPLGVFTRAQVHTMTFVKQPRAKVAGPGQASS